MSRRTKLIAVRVGASCTGSGFSSKNHRSFRCSSFPQKVTYGSPYYQPLRARLQRMSFWCAGVGLLGRIRPHGDNDSLRLEHHARLQGHGG